MRPCARRPAGRGRPRRAFALRFCAAGLTAAGLLAAGPLTAGPLTCGAPGTGAFVASAQEPGSTPGDAAPSAFQEGRIERALENRLACRGCHRIDGRGGLIGPVLDGVGSRSDPAHVLAMIRDPAGTVPGTIMPRQRMPERDARRLAAYLLTLAPVETSGSAQAPEALPPGGELDGAALYARHCAACHGNEGRGDGWNATNLGVSPTAHADPEAMALRPDDTLYDAIAAGGFVLDRSPLMPAFGQLLAPEQIRALVAHIRTLCSCTQPAWAERGR